MHVDHKLLSLSLGTESLLNTNDDCLEFFSVLHEVLSPSFALNEGQDLLLDDVSGA